MIETIESSEEKKTEGEQSVLGEIKEGKGGRKEGGKEGEAAKEAKESKEDEEEDEEDGNELIHDIEERQEQDEKTKVTSEELTALQDMDEKASALQKEGRYTEALECMEKGLVLRQHIFGSGSESVWKACKTVAELCNLLAMTYLQQEEYAIVNELLLKAEILTEKDPGGKAVTLNNQACYYRRQGQLHEAIEKLNHAIKIESRYDHLPNRADTHLNMCAVLSQLGKHSAALEHGQSALVLLHEEIFVDCDKPETKVDRIAVLAIAYHNVGVEYEFMKKYDLSIQSYKKGIGIVEKYMGENHGIVIALKNSLVGAKKAIHSATKRDVTTMNIHTNSTMNTNTKSRALLSPSQVQKHTRKEKEKEEK